MTSPGELGRIQVTELTHIDSARLGSTATRARTATLTVTGATTSLAYRVTAQGASDWLVLGASSGTAPGSLSITLDPAGLALGEHRDTLIFTGDGPDAVPVRVGVAFRLIGCRVEDVAEVPGAVTAQLTTEDCASPRLPGRFARLYRFAGAADDSVTLQATSAAFAPSIAISSAAEGAAVIDASDDCAVGAVAGNACLRYVRLPSAGQYVVEVTSVATDATGVHSLAIGTPRAPSPPTALLQETTGDPPAVIAEGGAVTGASVRSRASLADADLDSLRLEVELRPAGESFTGVATATSAWGSGSGFAVEHTGLVDDQGHHWRARALDATGRASDWVEFGTNASGASDFTVAVADGPSFPSALAQFRTDGTTSIAPGGSTNEPTAVLRAMVTDPDPGDQVRLEVELRAVGVSFTGVATASSGLVASGSGAGVSHGGLTDDVGYRWRARAVDAAGHASAWQEFGAGDAADLQVALPPSRLAFVVDPSDVAAGAVISPGVRVAAQDASGTPRTSFGDVITLSLGNNPAGGTLGGTLSAAAVDGVALFADLSLDMAGAYTLIATAGALNAASDAFTVGAGAAQALSFLASPTTGVAGVPLTPAPQVQVRDAQGNIDIGFAGDVTIALGTSPWGGTLGGTATVIAAAGVATFDDVFIDVAGPGYVLSATANGLASAQGGPLTISAGASSALAVAVPPSTTASSGVALATQPAVRLLDAFANPVSQAGTQVTATLVSGPAGSSLMNALASTDATGVATFSGLAISGSGGAYSIAFNAPGLTGATSGPIALGAGAASRLSIVTQPPAGARSGDGLAAIVVRLLDASGNNVAAAGRPVTAVVATGGGTLGGTSTVATAADGTATFDDLSVTGTVGARTLRFESTGLAAVTSGALTLAAGDATQMSRVSAEGQSALVGANVAAVPSVLVRDVSGNPVSGVAVNFTITAGGGSVNPATAVATNAAGAATLTSWTLGATAGANSVEATADGLAGSPVTFSATGTAGVATAIQVAGGDDLTAPIGATLGTPHEVRVVDANGNPVAGVAVAWSAIGGGTVAPSLSVSGADGIASTVRTLGNAVGAQSTSATASVAGGTASVTFDIIATTSGASSMALTSGDVQAATVGTTLAQPLAVQVRDVGNNPVSGVLITWAVIDGGGSVAPATSLTDASGIATTSWTLGTVTTPVDSTQLARATGVGSPVNFVATSRPGAVSAAQTLVAVAPSSAGASRTAPVVITITARDAFANPVPSQGVVLAASGTGNTLTQPLAVTDVSGTTTGAFGSTTTGTHTISATVNALPATQQPVVTIVPAPATRLSFTVPPSDATAGAAIAPSVTVELLDSLGNRATSSAANITLSLSSNPGASTLGGTVTRAAIAGLATFNDLTLNRAAAGYQLGATSGILTGVVSPAFEVTVGTVSAVRSSVVATPGSVPAGIASTITVTARDANDNPVAGALVELFATGAGNAITQPVGVTDAAGVATGTVSSTVAGPRSVTATIAGLDITQSASLTVVPAAVSASESGISAAPPSILADGGTSTISVVARDAFGNAVPGLAVVLAASGQLNAVTQPAALTNAFGVATGTVSSTRAEVKTVTATVGGVPITATATVTVGVGAVSAARSTLVATSSALVAGGSATTIIVTALDANDNPIPGLAVVLSASGSGNTLAQPLAVTNASGVATGTFASTGAGSKTITAIAGATGVAQAAIVSVAPAPVSAARSSVSAAPLTVAPGAPSAVTVVARDEFDNVIAGAPVMLASSGTENVFAQPAVTGANGSTSGTISSTVAESKLVTATIDGVLVTEAATVTVTAGTVSGTMSTAVAAPASIVAGTATSTITVTARDASGNPVPGAEVVLTATGTANTLVQPAAVTDANGIATGSIASERAETKTVSATIAGVPVTPAATVTMVPAANSAATSTVELSSSVISAGVGSATITVTVMDAFLNPVPGVEVVLAATGDGNTIVQPMAVTNAAGVAAGTISSTASEAKTITATAGGTLLAAAPVLTVTPDAADAAQSTLELSAATVAAGVDVTVTVTARDAEGNVIPGVTVAIGPTGANNTIVQPALTDVNGVATGTFRSTAAGDQVVSATVNGVAVVQTGALAVTPAAISDATSTVVSSVPTIVAGAGTATITATVRDAFSNPVPGAMVELATAEGTLTQPAEPTNAAGIATGTYSSLAAGAKTVSATAGATAITQVAAVTVGPAAVDASASSLTVDPASITAAEGTSTISVVARDQHMNLVPGATVVLAASGDGNTLAQPLDGIAGVDGTASGTLSSTSAGEKTVTATVGGTLLAASPVVTVNAGAANGDRSTIQLSHANAAAGEEVSVTVTARDGSGNPLMGATVVIAVTGDQGSVSMTQPGTTSALGVAAGVFTSTSAGTRTVSATVNGVAVAPAQDVVVGPAAVSAAASLVVVSPDTIVATGGVATVTITVRDQYMNPIEGALVTIGASGTADITQPLAPTNASGVTSGSVSAAVPGDQSITASVGALPLTPQPELTVVAGAVDAAQSAVSVSAPSTAANVPVTVTVTARDALGNPVTGATVVVTATGEANSIGDPVPATDVNGISSVTFSSTHAEARTISATASGTPITQTQDVTVTPGPVSASLSTVVAEPAAIAASGTSTITVTALDAFSNPIPDAAVVLMLAEAGATLTPPAATTDAAGATSGSLIGTTPGTKTVSATINGTSVTTPAVVTVSLGAVSTALSTLVVSSLAEAVGTEITVTVTALDAGSNPVPGQAVVVTAAGDDSTFTSEPVLTNALGVATATFSSTHAEVRSVGATVGGISIAANESVSFAPGPLSLTASTVAPASPTIIAGAPAMDIVVTARDAFGNPLAGLEVALSSSGTGDEFPSQPGATDAAGVATGTFSSTGAGPKSITAVIASQEFAAPGAVTVLPAALSAANSTLAVGDNALVAGTDTTTVTATLHDAFLNRVPGIGVTFAAAGDGTSLTETTVVTNAEGIATTRFSATIVGEKTVSASAGATPLAPDLTIAILPGAPSPLLSTFVISAATLMAGDTIDATLTLRDVHGNLTGGVDASINVNRPAEVIESGEATDASGELRARFVVTQAGAAIMTFQVNGSPFGAMNQVFEVVHAPATHLAFVGEEMDDAVAGEPISLGGVSPIGVVAPDQFVNATDFTGQVVISIAPGTGTPGATFTTGSTVIAAMVNGAVTLPPLVINTAGTGYQIMASAAGLTDAVSLPFDVAPAAAAAIGFAVPPLGAAAGAVLPDVVVEIRDAFGNQVPAYTGSVTIDLLDGDTDGTLIGTATLPAVSGVATFPGLSIDVAGAGYVFRASAEGLTGSVDSNTFDITPVGPMASVGRLSASRLPAR